MARIRAFATVLLPAILIVACNSNSPSAPSPAGGPATVGSTISGVIGGFTGTRSAFQFTVGTTQIQGDSNTAFDSGTSFNDLADGLAVQVTGAQTAGAVRASQLGLTASPVVVTGVVSTKNGSAAPFIINIESRTTLVTARTAVTRKGDPQSADTIAGGQMVDVVGRMSADGTLVAGTLQILWDSVGGMFRMTGTVGTINNLGWVCPKSSFTVTGYTIETDGLTQFTGTACGGLTIGDRVEVSGIYQPDFSIQAMSIKKL